MINYQKFLSIAISLNLLMGTVPVSTFGQSVKKPIYTFTPSKNQYDVSLVSETTRHVPSERALAIKNLEFKDAVTRMSNLKNINVTPGKLEASETSEAYRYFTSVGKSKRSSSAAHGKIISEYYHILRDYEYLKADATGREVWTAPGRGHKDMYITVKNADGSVKMAVTFNALNKGFLKAFAKSFEKVTDRETALHYSEQVYKIMLKTDGVDYDTNHVLAAYFKKGLELKWVCDEVSGMEIREDWAIARNKKDRLCPNAVTSMLALGYLGQGEQNVYEFLNHNYMGRNAHAVLKGGANALMLMDSEASYEALKKVIKNSVKKATPTNVFKIALNAFFDLIWVTSYVERGYKYFKGVYNNEVTIRFEYPDVKHIKKFGLPSTAGKCTPFSSTRDCVMMPTRNVWEDIGSELILFGGARGKKLVSELVSEEPNLHKPFTIGAAIYSDYNQKLYYAYKAGSAYADMPEGTRRRIELELGRGSAINENHIGMVTEYRKAMSGARGFDQIMGGVYMVALVVSLPSFMEFVASIPQWARGSRIGRYFSASRGAQAGKAAPSEAIGSNLKTPDVPNVNTTNSGRIGYELIKDYNKTFGQKTPGKTPAGSKLSGDILKEPGMQNPVLNTGRPQIGARPQVNTIGDAEVLTQTKPKTQPKTNPLEANVYMRPNLLEKILENYTKVDELLQSANKGKGASTISDITGTGAANTARPSQTPNITKAITYVTVLAGTLFSNKTEQQTELEQRVDSGKLERELNNARNGVISEFLLANFYSLSQDQQKELNKILDEVSKRPKKDAADTQPINNTAYKALEKLQRQLNDANITELELEYIAESGNLTMLEQKQYQLDNIKELLRKLSISSLSTTLTDSFTFEELKENVILAQEMLNDAFAELDSEYKPVEDEDFAPSMQGAYKADSGYSYDSSAILGFTKGELQDGDYEDPALYMYKDRTNVLFQYFDILVSDEISDIHGINAFRKLFEDANHYNLERSIARYLDTEEVKAISRNYSALRFMLAQKEKTITNNEVFDVEQAEEDFFAKTGLSESYEDYQLHFNPHAHKRPLLFSTKQRLLNARKPTVKEQFDTEIIIEKVKKSGKSYTQDPVLKKSVEDIINKQVISMPEQIVTLESLTGLERAVTTMGQETSGVQPVHAQENKALTPVPAAKPNLTKEEKRQRTKALRAAEEKAKLEVEKRLQEAHEKRDALQKQRDLEEAEKNAKKQEQKAAAAAKRKAKQEEIRKERVDKLREEQEAKDKENSSLLGKLKTFFKKK
ncbi:hypothetical protein AAIR98_001190 [Elusimicrobium simillimum]|uniref:hypothetical protein n=1 Tax=Elusimicrobium simillimum TaxID=3143438 RepID=UPI003C6F7607